MHPDTQARLERFRELGGVVPDEGAGAGDGHGDEGALLLAILDSGSFLPGLLFASGDLTAWPALIGDAWLRTPKPAAVFWSEASAATAGARDFEDFKRRLRRYRRREMLRLGARELGWGTTEEVAVELSGFADACLELSFRFADADLRREYGEPLTDEGPASFVVIAMGKLGGDELNFSSDVDLCYFYSSDAGQAGERSLHAYHSELARRITAAIEEVTDEGMIFRVDLRLRPEGRSGPLCNSLAAAERYYETFGRTWERQALLRARPCAGDRIFGARLLAMLEPFVYPRSIAPRMVQEIRELRAMFRPPETRGDDATFDVKLGAGGIRDVELVVQTLQLLHGGKRRDLRDRTTPRALHRLWIAGLITDREARALAAAYQLWRHLEHRVQLEDGAQTHRVPGDPAGRARLAERLGWPNLAALDATIARHRAAVRDIVATFDDPSPPHRPEVAIALDPTRSRAEVERALVALGFAEVEPWVDGLEVMRARMPPAFLEAAAASPDPDRALAHFRDLAWRGSDGLIGLLRDHAQVLRMLATLFGTSDRLSELLLRHPAMWESFTQNLGALTRTPEEIEAEAAARLRAIPADREEHEEAGLRELRRFQAEELLRIGLHDVAGSLEPGEVGAQLAGLAQACLIESVGLAAPALVARYGLPASGVTVLGLGSLGAREMRYGSDVDLIFLYGSEGESSIGIGHQEWYARASQRFIGSLEAMLEEGRLYHVDTRLRPSGAQGMLVTSVKAFERYHQQEAAGWERVALLRARVVYSSEPPASRAALEAMLEAIAYERPFDEARFRADLGRVRKRVEDERGKVVAGARHLRFDPGGIMDVEFMVALGQLSLGAGDRALRTTSTVSALARLVALGWPATLSEDYAFLRRLALRLRLVRGRPDDVLSPGDLAPLARTLERPPDSLAADLARRMQRVRTTYLTMFP
jgi:[glutamine synthetase] adenylyltransferase / [glutamine synthetase]-adenylyl-L-tyrosine phosphorylase